MKKYLIYVLPFLVAGITFLGLNLINPPAESLLKFDTSQINQDYKETIHFVAVGDSLTEGVGDETDSGGFVPLVAHKLESQYQIENIQTENFGVSGERSDQILKRVNQDDDLRSSLRSADLITLTVGGNDLMQAFQKNLTATSPKKFNSAIDKYAQNVEKIITKTRALNSEAPIYIVGIYNPYYLNFQKIKGMQTVVDNWNARTKELAEENNLTYFVPVNDLLYKGYTDTTASSQTTNDSETVSNNLLSTTDNFHPNNLGYQVMANAISQRMIKTNGTWLMKE